MADNDILNSLKGMLGDNADEKINSVMNMLKGNSNIDNDIKVDEGNNNISKSDTSNMISPESLRYISQIKSIIDEMGSANDPRSNLLMSLRPYMNKTRQKSIDNAVKILNLSRISGLFKI